MNVKVLEVKTKTANSYIHSAADAFFNALSFNARAKASANFAQASFGAENEAQTLRKLSAVQEPLRKVC